MNVVLKKFHLDEIWKLRHPSRFRFETYFDGGRIVLISVLAIAGLFWELDITSTVCKLEMLILKDLRAAI